MVMGAGFVDELKDLKTQVTDIANETRKIREALTGRIGNGEPTPGLIQKLDNLAMQTRWQWAIITAIALLVAGRLLEAFLK